MRIYFLPLLILLLSSTPYQPYVDQFEKMQEHSISTSITIVSKFSDPTITKTAIGVCYYAFPRKIELLKSYWDSASYTSRKLLIFHELGHCELNREHFDKEEQGFALSIMRWFLLSDYKYQYCEKEYDNELFTYDMKPLLKCINRYYEEKNK